MYFMKIASLLFLYTVAMNLKAANIMQWNQQNIVTENGPYILELTYSSVVYEDLQFNNSNGAVIWVESDVMSPGMSVVHNDDMDGSNCLMTAGINPEDFSTKQCSDPFQTSKRFKLSATATGNHIDLLFDVSDPLNNISPYRIMEKFLNSTGLQISDFNIELGFGLGDDFIPAPANIGLDFSDRDGNIWIAETSTADTSSIHLDALFPFGLFGNAATDPNHDIDGYFDSTERARFYLSANRGKLTSTGLAENYRQLFGDFLAKSQVINGYLWDSDDDDSTDPVLIAHQTEAGWFTLRPDQWWIDLMLPVPDKNLLDGSLADTTLAQWAANPDDYAIDSIEDLANLNLNYHITLGDISMWPTYDSDQQSAVFTLRTTSYSVIFKNGFD